MRSNSNTVWQSDGSTTVCSGCYRTFTVLLRRHHCRKCGKLFCGDCTKGRVQCDKIVDQPKGPFQQQNYAKLRRACSTCVKEQMFAPLGGPGVKFPPLNIGAVAHPRDPASCIIGKRWFHASGGSRLELQSQQTYESYLRIPDASIQDDVEQIIKDTSGRTDPRALIFEDTREFLLKLPPETSRAVITRILKAYCQRNSNIGYAQGMNYITLLLLAFLSEEEAFWTLCAIVERMRLQDFYAKGIASMNGYLIERDVLVALTMATFPELLKVAGENEVVGALEILSPKWMISLFVDVVPLKANILIWDAFFTTGADAGVFPILLSLIGDIQKLVIRGQLDLLTALKAKLDIVSHADVTRALDYPQYQYTPKFIGSLRNKARLRQSLMWSSGDKMHLGKIARTTSYTREQLQEFHSVFKNMTGKTGEGITKNQLTGLLEQAGLNLPDELVKRVFVLYDTDNSGSINFMELVSFLSLLSDGNMTERMGFYFDLFDTDSSGFLEQEEVWKMSQSLAKMIDVKRLKGGTTHPTTHTPTTEPLTTEPATHSLNEDEGEGADEGAEEEQRQRQSQATQAMLGYEHWTVDKLVARFATKLMMLDSDKDGSISKDEFLRGMRGEPLVLGLFSPTSDIVVDGASRTEPERHRPGASWLSKAMQAVKTKANMNSTK